MRNRDAIQREIYQMLLEYVCCSEEIGYCNNCPNLRFDASINNYDCPYGLDCSCCEYSPESQLEADVDKIMLTIEACKP